MDTLKLPSAQLAKRLISGTSRRVRYIRQHWQRLRKAGVKTICTTLLPVCLFGGGFITNPAQAAATKEDEVAQKVYAIISYSKWETTQPIQLCIAGNSRFADAIEAAGQAAYWPRVIVSKQHFDAKLLGSQCDVIFFGNISPSQQQSVIAARQNRALLTITDSNTECEIGSSFCLEPDNTPVTFKVNLDSLTRSGIYVNPNVLLLGRKKTAP